ncbi:MAG: hypothetical protein QOF58_4823 [Pseudonocardiales bacterium]|jgi:hypothetical protein|nr:hypothetical protein [Pseudonocardiales bacterium]
MNDHDSLAKAYTESNETGIYNACYERPAMMAATAFRTP